MKNSVPLSTPSPSCVVIQPARSAIGGLPSREAGGCGDHQFDGGAGFLEGAREGADGSGEIAGIEVAGDAGRRDERVGAVASPPRLENSKSLKPRTGVPLSMVSAPVTAIWSELAVSASSSNLSLPLPPLAMATRSRLPTVNWPAEAPGATLPAAATVTAPPRVPVPPRVPPVTETALEASSEPGLLTSRVPCVDGGGAGVGIDAAENLRAGTGLGEGHSGGTVGDDAGVAERCCRSGLSVSAVTPS